MKTLLINSHALLSFRKIYLIIPLALLSVWYAFPTLISYLTPTAGLLDGGVIQIILLGFTCYLLLLLFCWWFLNYCWQLVGLTQAKMMVSQFQTLTTWQQLGFYWASFALLLLAGVGALAAVL